MFWGEWFTTLFPPKKGHENFYLVLKLEVGPQGPECSGGVEFWIERSRVEGSGFRVGFQVWGRDLGGGRARGLWRLLFGDVGI